MQAADKSDAALKNYTGTDFTSLFQGVPELARVLETTLASRALIPKDSKEGKWSPVLAMGIEAFKKSERLTEKGISLRVLDKLAVVDQLSAEFDAIQAR